MVVAVAVAEDPNAALAPVDGAVNVTVTPLTGLPLASLTVAWSPVVNAVFTAALCGVPAVVVTLDAIPAVFVMLNLAGAGHPATLAVTM